MQKIGKISILHVIFLVMTFIGLKNHVTILPPILGSAKRDGWASVILATLIMAPWLLLIIYIQNKTNQQPIKFWLKEKIGNVGASIILYLTVFQLFILAAFTMRETLLWIKNTFLVNTPELVLLAIYVILCFLLVSTNIQTFVIANAVVLFVVVILGFYVAIVNIQYKNYDLLRPFFEHGFSPILQGAIYPAAGFIELFLILFLQHHLKSKMKWTHLLIMLFILTGLTLGPLIGAIVEFGPEEASKQRYPAYEEWGLVSIGRFIEHMDFLSIYQWLTGTFIRVGLLLFIAADILNITGKRKQIWRYMVPPFFFLTISLYFFDNMTFLHLNNHEILIITFTFFFCLSIVFALIAFFSKGKKEKTSNLEDR